MRGPTFPPLHAARQAGVVARAVAAVALVVALCVVATAPASAHSRTSSISVRTSGTITGPTTASGTFTSEVGRMQDSGTYTETYTLVGDEINAEKILTGRRGTLTIRIHGFLMMQTETMATFRGGAWRIVSGTRAYTSLRGGGQPGVASGSADLATGVVNVVHRGTARHGRVHDHEHGRHDRRPSP
jgi:hypothetical protein